MRVSAIVPLLAFSCAAAPLLAGDVRPAPFEPETRGGPWSGTGPADVPFVFRAPDRAVGADVPLVLLLHDAGADENSLLPVLEDAGFAPDGLVVAPRGTTPALGGGFRFRSADRDVRRVLALLETARARFGVRRAFALGHGEGGGFALFLAAKHDDLFAGAAALGAPDRADVPPLSGAGRAACLVHGADDAVVAPSQCALLAARLAARGGRIRTRIVEGAGHDLPVLEWSGALAWLRGLVSDDPAVVAASLETLRRLRNPPDLSGRLEIGRRLLAFRGGPPEARRRASADVEAIEALARAHLEAIRKERGRRPCRLEARPWIGHARLFLRRFSATEAAATLREEWKAELLKQRDAAAEALGRRRAALEEDPRAAFLAGVDAVARGYLTELVDDRLVAELEAERANRRALGLRSTDLRYFDRTLRPFRRAMESGREAFEKIGAAP